MLENNGRESFIKTIDDTDYTVTTVSVYNLLSKKYGYTARISNIFILLRDSFMIEEFALMNFYEIRNMEIESWLLGAYQDWRSGIPIDFVEVYKSLELAGDFSNSEKKLFKDGLVEERLWAIFMVIDGPDKTFN